MLGSVLLSIASTFCEPTPRSSASVIANCDHLTMSNHRSSPWRTAGAKGSFEMSSGRTTCWSGCGVASLNGRERRWRRR